MIFSQQSKLLREDRYNGGWSHSTQPLQGKKKKNLSHILLSQCPLLEQHASTHDAISRGIQEKARKGGYVCTQPWDRHRIASFPNMKRILCQVVGSPCSPHAYSIAGFTFDRRQLYVTVNAPLTWKRICIKYVLHLDGSGINDVYKHSTNLQKLRTRR